MRRSVPTALAAEGAGKAIEATAARTRRATIRDKYVARRTPPTSRILFVPTEGLYAEALRRPGLVEALQREHRVTLAGPTTLLATLTSLQMGFRTLALEKRSTEVWEVLGAVKTEFDKFGAVLATTKKKLRRGDQHDRRGRDAHAADDDASCGRSRRCPRRTHSSCCSRRSKAAEDSAGP